MDTTKTPKHPTKMERKTRHFPRILNVVERLNFRNVQNDSEMNRIRKNVLGVILTKSCNRDLV